MLRTQIKAKGYTQEVFAEAIGVSYSSMMAILQGKRHIYLHTYVKILDVLGMNDSMLSRVSNRTDTKKTRKN